MGGSSDYKNPDDTTKVYNTLTKQSGTQNYLFYGETNHKGLGSLQSVTVIDQNQTTYVDVNDTSDIRYPVLSTKFTYSASDRYSDLYVDRLSYVSEGKAYSVSMKKTEGETPEAVQNSNASQLSNVAYTKVNYLGATQYLTTHNDETNETVLITPDMGASDAPIVIGDRKFLTVTYLSFGEDVDGYLLYNNTEKEVQKCSLDMQRCSAIAGLSAGSRDFDGDIAGTTYSVFFTSGGLFRVDKSKSSGAVDEVDLDGHTVASGHGTTSLKGDSFYFIADDHRLYRANIKTKAISQVTPKADEAMGRIKAITTDWVVYGSDTVLKAIRKDGNSTDPVVLVENTKTKGYKYVSTGIGNRFFFVPYSIDEKGNTNYKAV